MIHSKCLGGKKKFYGAPLRDRERGGERETCINIHFFPHKKNNAVRIFFLKKRERNDSKYNFRAFDYFIYEFEIFHCVHAL